MRSKEGIKVSKTAIAETVVSSLIVGLLLAFFGFYFAAALSAVCSVPVFLKSPSSEKLANELLDSYWSNAAPNLKTKLLALVASTVGLTLGFYFLLNLFVDPSRFLLVQLVAAAMLPFTLAAGAYYSVVSPRPKEGANYIANEGITITSKLFVFSSGYFRMILRSLWRYRLIVLSAILLVGVYYIFTQNLETVILVFVVFFLLVWLPFSIGMVILIPFAVIGFYFSLGAFIGILCRAFVIRVYSVVSFIGQGFSYFSENWLRTILEVSWKTTPQLVPNMPYDHELSFENWTQYRKRGVEGVLRYFFGLVFLFWPSVIYRYALKSTALIYVPIVWILMTPLRLQDEAGKTQWLFRYGQAAWERVTFWTSVLALAYPAVDLVDLDRLRFFMRDSEISGPFTPVHYFLVIDPSEMNWWYWISVPCAIANIYVALSADHLRKNIEAGLKVDLSGKGMKFLVATNQLRIFLALLWILATLYSALYASYILDTLPNFLEPMFDLLFD